MTRCRRCADSPEMCLGCASRYLGVSRASVTRMLKAGEVAFYAYPAGGRRIAVAELDRFKARKRVPRVSPRILAAAIGPVEIEIERRKALKKLGRAS